jgi:hypothetical protein
MIIACPHAVETIVLLIPMSVLWMRWARHTMGTVMLYFWWGRVSPPRMTLIVVAKLALVCPKIQHKALFTSRGACNSDIKLISSSFRTDFAHSVAIFGTWGYKTKSFTRGTIFAECIRCRCSLGQELP